MRHNPIICFLSGTILLMGCTRQKTTAPLPNVLLIFPDQMRAEAMSCMNNPDVKTPNLDQLAANGVLLTNTYSNTPVCCPARATILTGKYAHSHGLVTNDLRLKESEITLAELFKEKGYQTGFIGKWHLDGGPKEPGYISPERRQGFDFWTANECSHNHFRGHYFKGTDTIPTPFNEFEPKVWVDEAINFLKKKKNSPFFLTIAPGPPHDPYIAPEKFRNLYDTTKITMPPNWEKGIKNGSKYDLANYYGMITAIDEQLGRLFSKIDSLGLRENTIILFISDHGDMLGSQGRIFKRQPWEESAKVPGIISWPKIIPSGKKTKALFSTVDVLPTLLDFCGIEIPAFVQGVSIKNVILQDEPGQKCVYLEILGPCAWQGVESGWRGICTAGFKYARYSDRPWILYDLENDPFELNNLVGNPEYSQLQKEMDALLAEQMKKHDNKWENNWTYPFADNFELGKYQAFYSIDEYLKWKDRK